MCQSKADGGRRCASHTRAALRRAHKTLGGPDNWPQPGITYPPDSPQARFRQALTNHAATPTGRRELQHKLDHETNPDRRAELTTALNAAEGDTPQADTPEPDWRDELDDELFPICNEDRRGKKHRDEYNQVYVCTFIEGLGWCWKPVDA